MIFRTIPTDWQLGPRCGIKELQELLVEQMRKTSDPMLAAFENRTDRENVREVLVSTYGPQGDGRPKNRKAKKLKK